MHSVLNVPYKKNGTKTGINAFAYRHPSLLLTENDKISVIKIRIGKLSFFQSRFTISECLYNISSLTISSSENLFLST